MIIPTTSKGGNVVKDVVGTSSIVVWEEVGVVGALAAVSHDVVLS